MEICYRYKYLEIGIENLLRHINNIKGFGLNTIVALNKYSNDTMEEINYVEERIKDISEFSILESWEKGSEGALDLANKVVKICDKESQLNYTYNLDEDIKTKIEKVCTKIYGAEGVEYSNEAINQMEKIKENYPICIAKTQYSFSDDPKNLLCDKPYKININSVELKSGAEFIVVKTGKIITMPGLPKVPSAEKIDIDEDGQIVGIF